MKTIYKKGNLLNAEESIIMHGCNAQGVMGSGVAVQIRRKFPSAYHTYLWMQEVYGLYLGDISIDTAISSCDNARPVTIINAITQEFYGRDGRKYASYDAIAKAAEKVNGRFALERIAIPKIGAGLGGGNWQVIESILENHAPDIQWVVYEL